jgi:3-methyladenine DNA glycosylase AlkD
LQRFGIAAEGALGVRAAELHRLAHAFGRSHPLALRLWRSGVHEARHLACLVEEPGRVSEAQMERWARAFDSWSIVDCCCRYLFLDTPFAWKKAVAWSRRREVYVKRAGYVLMAYLAQHDRRATAAKLRRLLPLIHRGASDDRRAVSTAVNWALRQIGKRSPELNRAAMATARTLASSPLPSARWVGTHALRELTGPAVQRRLRASLR